MINHRRSTSSIMVRSSKVRNEHKRSVSFNTMAEICYMEHPPSSTASDQEEHENLDPSELWWTARDYRNNKRRCRSTAKRLSGRSDDSSSSSSSSSDEDNDDGDFDTRGLERMMDGGERRAQMLLAMSVVQREQARYRLDGDVDEPELVLAEVYGVQCITSQVLAERRGRLDADAARALMVSDWGSSPTSSSPAPPTANCESSDREASRTKKSSKASKKSQKSSARCRQTSSDRVPFRENLKFSLANVMNRRRHAWI